MAGQWSTKPFFLVSFVLFLRLQHSVGVSFYLLFEWVDCICGVCLSNSIPCIFSHAWCGDVSFNHFSFFVSGLYN